MICNMIMFKKILNVFDKERELLKIKSWLKNHDVFYKSSKYSYEYINNEWFVNSDSDIDIIYKDFGINFEEKTHLKLILKNSRKCFRKKLRQS